MRRSIYITGLLLAALLLNITDYATAQTHRKQKKEYTYTRKYTPREKHQRSNDRHTKKFIRKKKAKEYAYNHKKLHRSYARKHKVVRHNRFYHHPRHGKVILSFATPPSVIRHQHGHYYYSGGFYYRYYPHVGYVIVDTPYNVYFRELPHRCKRFRIDGRLYFSVNDLCFVKYKRGYRLVSHPAGIHFSARY